MKRRIAREYILQMLFQHEFTGQGASELTAEFWKGKEEVENSVRMFATDIFRGTVENLDHIDEVIRQTAENWVLERMAIVDRNILRFACYELLYRNDIPPVVSINEAIEIAKKYSAQESSSFINGILDKIAKKYKKAPAE